MRAYSEALKAALETAPVRRLIQVVRAEVAVSFAEAARIYRLVDRFSGVKIEQETYNETGPVFHFRMEQRRRAAFAEAIQEALNREPGFQVVEETLDQV